MNGQPGMVSVLEAWSRQTRQTVNPACFDRQRHRSTTAGQAAGGQSVAQTCHKARQSVAQLPGRVFLFFFSGSSFLPSVS